MKKTLLASLLLIFGLSFQVQAASTNSNQGATRGQVGSQAQGNQTGNAVQTEEKNKVMNRGESNQIQTQEQNAVQAMLQIADRNGGIGQQVRVIAQNQNQNQTRLEQNVEKIQRKSGFAKFFMGPNFGEIKDAQNTLKQNKEQIRQLNQIKIQLSNEGDQQQLAEQIRVLEQTDRETETSLADAQSGFSLFGWLNKLIS